MSPPETDLKRFFKNPYARRVLIGSSVCFLLPAAGIVWYWIPQRLSALVGVDLALLDSALALPLLALLITGLASIAGLALTLFVVPFRKYERTTQELISTLPKPEQLQALKHELQHAEEQTQVILDDNIRLRAEIDATVIEKDTQTHLMETLVSTTDDLLVVTDADARIIQISQAAALLLGVRGEEVIGTDSFRVLRFFDAHKDNPEEYPLVRLIEDVVERASSVPFMTDVILLDSRSHRHRVMLTSQAIVRSDHKVAGSLLRLQPSEGEQKFSGAVAQSRYDSSTDLPSRGEFMRRLNELINIAQTQKRNHELLLFSVDDLQGIYDRFGYWAGEELLWKIASLARGEVAGQPEMFRITAVHFALVLPFSTAKAADVTAEKIRECVDRAQFTWQENNYRATISLGICTIDGQAPTPSAVISMADEYLRAARDAGGNQALRYRVDELLVETQAIEQQLMGWLDMSGETKHLQLHSRQFAAAPGARYPALVEAMLQVEMDDGFWMDAAAFRSSASNSGLSHKLDLWLLRHGATAFVEAPSTTEQTRLVVPCSGQSLEHENFCMEIAQILADSGLAAESLIIAVSERHARSYSSDVHRFRKALRELGVEFALSDCRVAALADLVPQLAPEYVGLPPGTVRRIRQPATLLEMRYFQSSAAEFGFELYVGDVKEPSLVTELQQEGVHYVADKGGALGPLSAFAGLQMPG